MRPRHPARRSTDERTPDDFTARRLAAREVTFRLINERSALAEFEDEEDRETLAEWESVRERPGCFVVAPGHEIPAIEDVVERRSAYVVVKKRV